MSARDEAARFPHLPAGREPGSQSLRNRTRRGWLGPFCLLVGAAMYAAGVWVAAGGRGGAFDRQEELWGGILFAAFGLLCVYGGWFIWRGGRTRIAPRLRGVSLAVADGALRRGDEVAVRVVADSANGAQLEVGLACDERVDTQRRVYVKGGASTTIRETLETTIHEEWQPLQPGAGEQTFRLRVPADGPYSYEGDCVSYAWRVSARAVRSLRSDARTDEPVWVDP